MRGFINFLLTVALFISISATGYYGWDYYQTLEQKNATVEGDKKAFELAIGEEPDINSLIKQKVDLNPLQQTVNKDITSWLHIPGTNINEAVLQHKQDTNYYLRRDINQNYNIYGVLFLDKDSDIETDFASYVFGHNTDLDNKFTQLEKFWDPNYKNKNWYMYKDNYQYEYELVARFEVAPKSSIYPVEEFSKENPEALRKALRDYNVDPAVVESINENDQYIFLITCENWDNSSARKVVLGKLKTKVKY